MPLNSKELVADLFIGKPLERTPFLPWVCSFAAKLEQVSPKAILSDPGLLSRALSNAQKLFGYDVILNHFAPGLEAEACGCGIQWDDDAWPPVVTGHPLESGGNMYDIDTENIETKGRIPVVIEATKRLILTKGKEVPVAALINGPFSLALQLKGDSLLDELKQEEDDALDLIEDTGNLCLKLCRVYCELGVDIVVIAEDLRKITIHDAAQVLASPLKSIFNVIRFYDIKSILVSKVSHGAEVSSLAGLGSDAVSVPGVGTSGGSPVCAVTIPEVTFLEKDTSQLETIRASLQSGSPGTFLSSDWEVPYDTDVNRMHDIMKIIRGE